MPLPRFHKLDDVRKQAILQAAEAEFSANGFSGASYNAIIKSAGLSKGAMYYYFADKADLCRTVVGRAFRQLAEQVGGLGEFDDAAGFWREVSAMSGRAIEVVMADPKVGELGRLIYGEGSNSEVLRDLVDASEQFCRDTLARGQTVDAVRKDMPLGLLASAVTGLLVHCDRWFASNLETIAPEQLPALSNKMLAMVELIARPQV